METQERDMAGLKWLLIGAGDIARKRVAAALRDAEESELVAVCDTVPENARLLADEYDLSEVYTEVGKALSESSSDAVYVATPVGLHVQHTIEAMGAGKHVLVENPLGLTGGDCARAVSAAEKSGVTAGCSYFRRLFPAYLHAKEMLEKDEFGRIVLARMVFFSWFSPDADDTKYWRVIRDRSGGGPISDMGTHMFDVMIGLLGMPTHVYARCDNLVNDWDVEDSASILMKMADGAHVTASFNWNSKTWRHEFEIVGTEAKVYWHPYDSGEVVKTVGRQIDTLNLLPDENVHLPIVQDFVAAVRDGRPPACPLDEAAKTNRLLDAIYRSSAENREVEV